MKLFSELEKFYSLYKGEKNVVGYSVLHRPIYAMKSGNGFPVGIVQGGIHGREWITARLVLEQIKLGVKCGTVWFLPLTNPDGAFLCTDGISSVGNEWRRKLLVNVGGRNFKQWKANANAVDLNVNFDARWGTGLNNVHFPSPSDFVGPAPFSEPETLALKRFTLSVRPDYTVSYHTQGKEIYWNFFQPLWRCMRDKKYADLLSRLTGYPLKYAKGSVGGYKDWCIERLKIPAFTVEAGRGEHPLGKEALPDILKDNLYSVRDFSAGFCDCL